MEISRGYVSKPCNHHPVHSSPCFQANVLIDYDGRARLTDIALHTVVSNQSSSMSLPGGGSVRWMSPELIDPGGFGLKETRPTKESDCYALGMVIFEVLSGRIPFSANSLFFVISRILNGERPEKPQGKEGEVFTDAIWEVLELCWQQKPEERTNAKAVLACLEGAQSLRLPPDTSGAVESDNDQSYVTASDTGTFSQFRLRPQAHLVVPQVQRLRAVTTDPQFYHRILPLLRQYWPPVPTPQPRLHHTIMFLVSQVRWFYRVTTNPQRHRKRVV